MFKNCPNVQLRTCTLVSGLCAGESKRENGRKGTGFKAPCVCVCSHFQDASPMLTNDAPVTNDDPDVVCVLCVLVVIKSIVLACRYKL